MKISFVIPAYNEEKLIGKCLGSIEREIERSGYEAEIIVADNGSTDRTREIAASFPRTRAVEERWKGANRARQTGLRASTGEFIASLDADTIIPSGWLTTAMHEFERDPELAAITGPFIYYDLPAWKRFLARIFISTYPLVNFLIQNVFHAGAVLQGGNFVVRRAVLEKIGGHNTSIEFYGDDTDTARRLSKIGNVKWTFKLPIYTSARRLKHEGITRVGFRYALNFFWMTFFGKPYTLTYKDIRPSDKDDRRPA
ncbi:MAG: glycosyltransferase family A protein [Patescibacteria group bacterium]